MSAFTRRFSFRAVHSLNTGVHSEKRHGHEYAVEVSFTASDVAFVDRVVDELILQPLHGRDLTRIADPATGEVLVEWIHARLHDSPLAPHLLGVALQETRKNRFVSAATREFLL